MDKETKESIAIIAYIIIFGVFIYFYIDNVRHPIKYVPEIWHYLKFDNIDSIVISPTYDYNNSSVTVNKTFYIKDKNVWLSLWKEMQRKYPIPSVGHGHWSNYKRFKMLYKFKNNFEIAFFITFDSSVEEDYGSANFIAYDNPKDNMHISKGLDTCGNNLYNILSEQIKLNQVRWVSDQIEYPDNCKCDQKK